MRVRSAHAVNVHFQKTRRKSFRSIVRILDFYQCFNTVRRLCIALLAPVASKYNCLVYVALYSTRAVQARNRAAEGRRNAVAR